MSCLAKDQKKEEAFLPDASYAMIFLTFLFRSLIWWTVAQNGSR
uniref:Uncharacterized protein n=1 Tax=Rhizophora mucronata TaxID=61149 RepID=A0A2P2PFX6_RHIMU